MCVGAIAAERLAVSHVLPVRNSACMRGPCPTESACTSSSLLFNTFWFWIAGNQAWELYDSPVHSPRSTFGMALPCRP